MRNRGHGAATVTFTSELWDAWREARRPNEHDLERKRAIAEFRALLIQRRPFVKSRWAAKRDSAEAPIIADLEARGFRVYQLDAPCDLACRKDHWPPGVFQFLEIKTGRGKAAKTRVDKRQRRQIEFIRDTGTPIVRTPEEALYVLNIFHNPTL